MNMNFFYVEQFPLLSNLENISQLEVLIITASLELFYTSYDIKAFADDLWNDADEELRNEIRSQWEENKEATGGHEWAIPEWAEAYPEIAWEKDKGIPLPPFKWDEERRAKLKAELDAYYALLYGLERDELRYILDPKDVYGEDFPGETFRVLKEKEIKKYGEYRTRRLVLEAYDRLRPDWDMEGHMERLKGVWEEYQRTNSKSQYPNSKQSSKSKFQSSKPETRSSVAETESPYKQSRLFDEPNLFGGEEGEEVNEQKKITHGSKVTIRHSNGQEYRYHITQNYAKGEFTGDYKQISPVSGLTLAMINKKEGDRFEFGGVGYVVVGVE